MKLAVVTPWSSPFTWRKFTENIARMMAQFRRSMWTADFFMGQGCDPAARHVSMIDQALDWGADLICIVGADQVHPLGMLDRLLDRHQEKHGDIIGALVPFRGYVPWQNMKPFQSIGWRLQCDGVRECRGMTADPDMFVPIDPDGAEMQRVDIIGSGVLMFHRDHVNALKRPWFYYKVDPRTMQRVADMDTKFVWRLRIEAGATIWVDTTIKVKHVHDMEIDETFPERFKDWEEHGDPTICKQMEDQACPQ